MAIPFPLGQEAKVYVRLRRRTNCLHAGSSSRRAHGSQLSVPTPDFFSMSASSATGNPTTLK